MKASAIVILTTLLAACVSGPETLPPAWYINMDTVYPNENYIAMRGRGRDIKAARTDARAKIALYFKAETSVLSSTNTVWRTHDGVTIEDRKTQEQVIVESQIELVSVRYADASWYNSAERYWEAVAYIDRDEAWRIYEPTPRREADTFLNLVQAADREPEPFNKVLCYGTAEAYTRSAEFNAVREFAQVLHPSEAERLFFDAEEIRKSLVNKQLDARGRADISVQCSSDYERILNNAWVKTLGDSGFSVTRGGNAGTVCVIQVSEGIVHNDIGIFYTPSLTAVFNGKYGPLMSIQVSTDRTGAVTPDVAKRRAYTALAAALKDAFPGELERWYSALVK